MEHNSLGTSDAGSRGGSGSGRRKSNNRKEGNTHTAGESSPAFASSLPSSPSVKPSLNEAVNSIRLNNPHAGVKKVCNLLRVHFPDIKIRESLVRKLMRDRESTNAETDDSVLSSGRYKQGGAKGNGKNSNSTIALSKDASNKTKKSKRQKQKARTEKSSKNDCQVSAELPSKQEIDVEERSISIFPEDVVCRRQSLRNRTGSNGSNGGNASKSYRNCPPLYINRHGLPISLGIVKRVAGWVGEDDQDDDEEEDNAFEDSGGKLKDGQCEVLWLWPVRSMERTKVSSLAVLDRMVLPSDPIARVDDPLRTLGIIVSTRRSVHVRAIDPNENEYSNGYVTSGVSDSRGQKGTYFNVAAENLSMVGNFCVGDWVMHNPTQWVGQVDAAQFAVVVKLDTYFGNASKKRGRKNRGKQERGNSDSSMAADSTAQPHRNPEAPATGIDQEEPPVDTVQDKTGGAKDSGRGLIGGELVEILMDSSLGEELDPLEPIFNRSGVRKGGLKVIQPLEHAEELPMCLYFPSQRVSLGPESWEVASMVAPRVENEFEFQFKNGAQRKKQKDGSSSQVPGSATRPRSFNELKKKKKLSGTVVSVRCVRLKVLWRATQVRWPLGSDCRDDLEILALANRAPPQDWVSVEDVSAVMNAGAASTTVCRRGSRTEYLKEVPRTAASVSETAASSKQFTTTIEQAPHSPSRGELCKSDKFEPDLLSKRRILRGEWQGGDICLYNPPPRGGSSPKPSAAKSKKRAYLNRKKGANEDENGEEICERECEQTIGRLRTTDVDDGDSALSSSPSRRALPVQIIGTRTSCVVRWADGTVEGVKASLLQSENDDRQASGFEKEDEATRALSAAHLIDEGLPALSVVPRSLLGEHDFVPFDFVVRSEAYDKLWPVESEVTHSSTTAVESCNQDDIRNYSNSTNSSSTSSDDSSGTPGICSPSNRSIRATGMVSCVDSMSCTATVRWLRESDPSEDLDRKGSSSRPSEGQDVEEECSIYELNRHSLTSMLDETVIRKDQSSRIVILNMSKDERGGDDASQNEGNAVMASSTSSPAIVAINSKFQAAAIDGQGLAEWITGDGGELTPQVSWKGGELKPLIAPEQKPQSIEGCTSREDDSHGSIVFGNRPPLCLGQDDVNIAQVTRNSLVEQIEAQNIAGDAAEAALQVPLEVGNIIGLSASRPLSVQVAWMNGDVSWTSMDDLFVLPSEGYSHIEDGAESALLDEDDDDEYIASGVGNVNEEEEEEEGEEDSDEDGFETVDEDELFEIDEDVEGFADEIVKRVEGSMALFNGRDSYSDAALPAPDNPQSDSSQKKAGSSSTQTMASASAGNGKNGGAEENDDECEDDSGNAFHVFSGGVASDHFFVGTEPEKVTAAKVHREWKRIQRGLSTSEGESQSATCSSGTAGDSGGEKKRTAGAPEMCSILVRAYDSRIDLLRAMIIGPVGTPYEGVPFLFDIQLPSDYPNSPPRVHYHSTASERLNPNLYEDGKVCLSLLGTWSGPGWVSGQSTLLQVLVSIQALILVENPFFNEPGFEKQINTPEGRQNSDRYNEKARLISLRSAMMLCRSPPRGFTTLIRRHFSVAGPALVHSAEGVLVAASSVEVPVGKSADGDAASIAPAPGSSLSTAVPSKGYIAALKRLLPLLRAFFIENGQ